MRTNTILTVDEEDMEGSITDHELNRRSVSERDFNEICKYFIYIYNTILNKKLKEKKLI